MSATGGHTGADTAPGPQPAPGGLQPAPGGRTASAAAAAETAAAAAAAVPQDRGAGRFSPPMRTKLQAARLWIARHRPTTRRRCSRAR